MISIGELCEFDRPNSMTEVILKYDFSLPALVILIAIWLFIAYWLLVMMWWGKLGWKPPRIPELKLAAYSGDIYKDG